MSGDTVAFPGCQSAVELRRSTGTLSSHHQFGSGCGSQNPGGETVVLHGTGGFGKTTLALSVCHDPDVFAAFDCGVLWVTLGEQPQIVIELERIYSALTGERLGFKSQAKR